MPAGWDEQYDVIVVGSGAGALTGAYLAARQGLRTVVVEKTALLGGTSAYSGGACWLPGSAAQQRAALPDSTSSAREYLNALLGDDQQDRQEAFLTQAPRLVDTLEQNPLLTFEWRPFPEYFPAPGRVPAGRSLHLADLPLEELGELAAMVRPGIDRDRADRGHRVAPLSGGVALIGRLLLAFQRTGSGTVRTDHRVDRLILEDDRVVGVEAVHGDRRIRLRARAGVLLAAGGFEGDQELRDLHGVPGRAGWSMAPQGTNSGEPLLAAIEAGADTDLLDEAWWCPGLELPDGHAAFTLGLRGGLIVDGQGHRYANESLPYDRMGRAMAANPSAIPSYLVFDNRWGGQVPAIAVPGGRPQEHLAAGTWLQAESLPVLAARIGVPAEALLGTVETFNRFAADGRDEDFHRGEDPFDLFFASGDGPNKALVPLDQPPYFAARLVLSDLGTKGGLRTDVSGRVLRKDGSPLPGLYAAGNTAASLTGAVYPAPGAPIGTAMVFASLAVEDMTRGSLLSG
jgi:succinate dehydrogenase/fumarate reductase flavoprotein subunit